MYPDTVPSFDAILFFFLLFPLILYFTDSFFFSASIHLGPSGKSNQANRQGNQDDACFCTAILALHFLALRRRRIETRSRARKCIQGRGASRTHMLDTDPGSKGQTKEPKRAKKPRSLIFDNCFSHLERGRIQYWLVLLTKYDDVCWWTVELRVSQPHDSAASLSATPAVAAVVMDSDVSRHILPKQDSPLSHD